MVVVRDTRENRQELIDTDGFKMTLRPDRTYGDMLPVVFAEHYELALATFKELVPGTTADDVQPLEMFDLEQHFDQFMDQPDTFFEHTAAAIAIRTGRYATVCDVVRVNRGRYRDLVVSLCRRSQRYRTRVRPRRKSDLTHKHVGRYTCTGSDDISGNKISFHYGPRGSWTV